MSKKNDNDIYVLDGRLHLRQIPDGFRTSVDSILLAAACPVTPGQRVLDLGCGVGSAGLAVITRIRGAQLTGVDILPDHVTLASDNAALNNLDHYTEFVADDIRDFEPSYDDISKRYDHVICNPPYLESGAHIQSPSPNKQLAIGEGEDDIGLKDWIDAAHRNLKSGGSFTIIHRGDAVDKIIRKMGKRFGAIEIIPLWSKLSRPAKRVIIRGIKDRKSSATIHPGIVLHDHNGDYTPAAQQILREGTALF